MKVDEKEIFEKFVVEYIYSGPFGTEQFCQFLWHPPKKDSNKIKSILTSEHKKIVYLPMLACEIVSHSHTKNSQS